MTQNKKVKSKPVLKEQAKKKKKKSYANFYHSTLDQTLRKSRNWFFN
jgi:hypothetical protein